MEGNSARISLLSIQDTLMYYSEPYVCVRPQVLVYDWFGQDIISPLLSVKELRDMGITLHL